MGKEDPPRASPPAASRPDAGRRAPLSTDELLVFCFSRLRQLASRMLSQFTTSRRQEDTDDLLQNAALRMRRALADVAVECPEHAMALAITQIKREMLDMIRRLRRRPDAAPGVAPREPAVNTESLDAWEAFHEHVNALPPPQREAVHFLWYLGLDQERAAEILGVSSRTLRRNWRMARDSLRRQLGDGEFFH